MTAASFKIDHVTVAGRDLGALRNALRAVGIPTEPGGPHANRATEMAIASFPDGSYLELIALQPAGDPASMQAHDWVRYLQGNAGPCAWAVQVPDVDAQAELLRTAGVSVREKKHSGRNRPDGVRLDWETVQIGPGNGTFFPFLIRDLTPRARRAYPTGKPNVPEYGGIKRVVIAVQDLDKAVQQYQNAYRLPEPQRAADPAFGAHLAVFAGTPVVLAAPLHRTSWLQRRLAQFGEAPCAFVLSGKAKRPAGGPESRWFGQAVSWFDPQQLGWWLGVE